MTTIAIIGGGIAARSLLFAMAKKKISEKILVFYSDSFAFPCSLHSTAIVAPRGVSTGLSPLGDQLHAGFERFKSHIHTDHPKGVIVVPQYTGAVTKVDAFKKRYPDGKLTSEAGPLHLTEQMYLAEESAFLIRPHEYMNWLLKEAQKDLDIQLINSFVTKIDEGNITTVDAGEFVADKIIFATGSNNDLWQDLFPEKKNTKSAQGCYLEFSGVEMGESFSLTLEGDNLIYDSERKTLLIGSTTRESRTELPPEKELLEIYQNLARRVNVKLPDFGQAIIKTGLREKGPKREPYILQSGKYSMLGGYYKNGYSVSLVMAEKLLSSR
ncbi:MAG: FAD-dependent oxidoreductase [Bdellovibrionota bacterium]